MLDLFGSVKGLVKLSKTQIDNGVFCLHYKLTVLFLVVGTVLVTARQYIGDPIDCVVDEIPLDTMDAYCWIYSTFTVPEKLNDRVGKDVVQPGVGQHIAGEDDVKYHKYYQWVCFVLFFQAILFYIPHYLWKNWEHGRIKGLVPPRNGPGLAEDIEDETIEDLAKYFMGNERNKGKESRATRSMFGYYAYRFIFCEFLNLINVIGQIFFLDFFLDGEFSTFGWDVLNFTNEDLQARTDPMSRVFPKLTKCTFHKYGASGTIQQFDGLCILPVNIVNEKIYVFLWFWFVALTIVTGIYLIYRTILIYSSGLRSNRLLSLATLANKEKVKTVLEEYPSYPDFFMLYQLGINLDPMVFKKFVSKLSKRIAIVNGTD